MSSLCRGSIVAGKKALLAPTGAVDAADRFLGLSRSPAWSGHRSQPMTTGGGIVATATTVLISNVNGL
jgi:hypothetical protein